MLNSLITPPLELKLDFECDLGLGWTLALAQHQCLIPGSPLAIHLFFEILTSLILTTWICPKQKREERGTVERGQTGPVGRPGLAFLGPGRVRLLVRGGFLPLSGALLRVLGLLLLAFRLLLLVAVRRLRLGVRRLRLGSGSPPQAWKSNLGVEQGQRYLRIPRPRLHI